MTVIHTRKDIPYLPIPNITEIVLDEETAPDLLVATAFVLAFTEDGRIVMATNQKRGVEFAGGHRDGKDGRPVKTYRDIKPGDLEDIDVAARRELWEEVGCRVASVRPLAYHRNECFGEEPEGYDKYTFPVSYQQFMVGIVTEIAAYEDNHECAQPVLLNRDEARERMNPQQWALASVAWEMLPELLRERQAVDEAEGGFRPASR
jgi:8-oxo-dGTP pyrophosphatase MutT (NUDIX family)